MLLIGAGLFIGLLSARPLRDHSAKPAAKPNILYILTDDHRFDGARALGTPELQTPNLDRLIAGGTAFTHAHILGGDEPAVCAPSRAMLMTGKAYYHLPVGFYSSRPNRPADADPSLYLTMPEYFRQNGYYTYMTGKWHNSRQSFAKSFDGGDNLFFGGMHFEKDGGHIAPTLHHFDSTGQYPAKASFREQKFSSQLYADAAVDFLKKRPSGNKPFMLYVAFTSPHDPRQPYSPFTEKYDPMRMKLPPNFMPRHPFDNGELTIRDEVLLGFPRQPDSVRREIALYYAMISEVDAQIGRIMRALQESGQADNTIVVWGGDNGLAVGQHGLLGKQNLYDHSIRVPLVFAGKGIPANKRSDALCYLHDSFPTLCELAGLPVPSGLDGKSVKPVLDGKQTKHRDGLWFAYRHPMQQGVRSAGGWKLIRYQVNGQTTEQLFNLREDRWEMRNLVNDPRYQTIRQRLAGQIESASAMAQR